MFLQRHYTKSLRHHDTNLSTTPRHQLPLGLSYGVLHLSPNNSVPGIVYTLLKLEQANEIILIKTCLNHIVIIDNISVVMIMIMIMIMSMIIIIIIIIITVSS